MQRSFEVFVHRVIVGVSGSAGSVLALRHAAEMARDHQAELVPVLAWTPPGGELADRRYPNPQLRAVWKQAAKDRLSRAIGLALGGQPDGLDFRPEIVRGEAGYALTQIACEPGDILVIGAGRHGALRRLTGGHAARYCLAHAACPVIAVPPAEIGAAAHGLRGWMDRHRMQPEDAALRTAA
jgi:nucleotide-binding universal stress UspA family protein